MNLMKSYYTNLRAFIAITLLYITLEVMRSIQAFGGDYFKAYYLLIATIPVLLLVELTLHASQKKPEYRIFPHSFLWCISIPCADLSKCFIFRSW